jgi:hypothetical protein
MIGALMMMSGRATAISDQRGKWERCDAEGQISIGRYTTAHPISFISSINE